jgi:ABC-type multidrug transport system ATPase subunit
MRLSGYVTTTEKEKRVLKIIQDLGLNHCADTPLELVSSGERKLTSVGIEIVSDPALLLLDEATSGLDNSSATSLSRIIRSIATSLQIPVVQSIHQMPTKMFYSFDKILLLSEGKMVYFGNPNNLMKHLLNLGYTPDNVHVNPADFILGLFDPFVMQSTKDILVEHWNKEKNLTESVVSIKKGSHKIDGSDVITEMKGDNLSRDVEIEGSEFYSDSYLEENIFASKIVLLADRDVGSHSIVPVLTHQEHAWSYPSSYQTQFYALLKRAFKTGRSSTLGFIIPLMETIILALMIGACYYQRPFDETHFGEVSSFLFLSIVYWFFVAFFSGILEFLSELLCLKKERESGMYRVSAYFLAKTLSTIPLRIVQPSLYVCIAYPMVIQDASTTAVFGTKNVLI